MSDLRHLFSRRDPPDLKAVPDRPSSLARAREAVGLYEQGRWTPAVDALALAWYTAVTTGERVSERDAAAVLRDLMEPGWTPGGDAA